MQLQWHTFRKSWLLLALVCRCVFVGCQALLAFTLACSFGYSGPAQVPGPWLIRVVLGSN